MAGGNEYNVSTSYKLDFSGKLIFKGGHSIIKVSDKGRNEVDYFNVGTTNEKGEFIPDPKLKFVSERGEGQVHCFRIIKDDKGIASSCIGLDKEGKEVKATLWKGLLQLLQKEPIIWY